ncbi:uncharacterized protein LOC144106345 isoform X4 [Amblyomma americanum]
MSWSLEGELKEDIKEALKANGIYSNDKLYDTMAVLEILGVKAAQHFELLETEDLVSRGMPPETADTLLKEFGPACGEAGTEPENEVFQEKGMEIPNWSCGVGLQNIGLSVAGVLVGVGNFYESIIVALKYLHAEVHARVPAIGVSSGEHDAVGGTITHSPFCSLSSL